MTKIPLLRMVLVVTAAALALAIAASAFAQSPPTPPHQFYGSAETGTGAILDGEAAPDGSVVTASNQDGENVGETAIEAGSWLIAVDPADADTVTFTIGDSGQSGSYDVVSGDQTEVALNLTTPAPKSSSNPQSHPRPHPHPTTAWVMAWATAWATATRTACPPRAVAVWRIPAAAFPCCRWS